MAVSTIRNMWRSSCYCMRHSWLTKFGVICSNQLAAVWASLSKSVRSRLQIKWKVFCCCQSQYVLWYCLASFLLFNCFYVSSYPLTPLRAEGRPAQKTDADMVFSFWWPQGLDICVGPTGLSRLSLCDFTLFLVWCVVSCMMCTIWFGYDVQYCVVFFCDKIYAHKVSTRS